MPEQTTKSIIVGTSPAEAFAAWSRFEEFPQFMEHLKSVTRTGERASHWVVEGPMGKDVEWDAETTTYEPGQRIAWRSTRDSKVTTSGQVTFAGLGTGQTEVTVTLQYVAPAGALGEKAARLLANPDKMLEQDLLRFKERVEGRVPVGR